MKLLIAHITHGGLCNRLRAMVSAKILADAMGRVFKVSWVPHEHCNCRATDLFGKIPAIDLQKIRAEEYIYYDFPESCTIADIEAQNNTVTVMVVHALDEFKPSAMPNSEYQCRFQKELQNLQPLPEIERHVLADAAGMIGLQIRRGDHWRATRYSPLALFQKVIDGYLKKDSNTKFFLCSDSPNVRIYLKKKYDKNLFFCETVVFRRHTIKGIQMALVDFLTLSRTRLIYKSYMSSFGGIAGKVYGTPVIQVVLAKSPKHWISSRGDFLISRMLEWDSQTQRWKRKKLKGATFWTRLVAFFVLMKCRFFYSPFYQIGVGRYLRIKRLVIKSIQDNQA